MKLRYEALTGDDNRIVRGEVEASTEREAVRQLEAGGMIITEIQAQKEKAEPRWRRALTSQELVLALFELSTMLESGVALAEAIDSQSQAEYHPELIKFFDHVGVQLRSGESLAQAIRSSELSLPDYLVQLIQSGELSGELSSCLRRGVEQMEYDLDVASQLRSALIYPSVLLLSGVVAVGLIFVLVVPKFAHLLERGADLPWLASAVLVSGMFFNTYYPLLLAGLMAAGGAAVWYLRKPEVRNSLYNRLAKLPVVGPWLLETEISRWASMMATLMASRVELLSALEMAAQAMDIEDKRRSLGRVSERVRQGESLSAALREQRVLTPTAGNLIKVGEVSGALAPMLASVAKLYDTRCKNRMTTVVALIEPLAILLVGMVIGVLVLGIILAITSVNTVSI